MNEEKAVSPPVPENPRRCLFADPAPSRFDTVSKALLAHGILCESVSTPADAISKIAGGGYDICLLNLLLGELGPFELIHKLRAASGKHDLAIVVISGQKHRSNIQNCIEAGANDFIVDPFTQEILAERILYHLKPKMVLAPSGFTDALAGDSSRDLVNLLLDASERMGMAPYDQGHRYLYYVINRLAALMQSNRTSLISIENIDFGIVLASSDDEKFCDYPIDLNKYPELQHAANSGRFIIIEDVDKNLMTRRIKEKVKSISIGSLMVFPIRFQGEVIAVLNVRRPTASELPPKECLRVMQAITMTLSVHARIKMLLRRLYKGFQGK